MTFQNIESICIKLVEKKTDYIQRIKNQNVISQQQCHFTLVLKLKTKRQIISSNILGEITFQPKIRCSNKQSKVRVE